MAGLAREEEVRQPQDGGRGAAASSLAPASPAQPQAGLQPGEQENISRMQKIFGGASGIMHVVHGSANVNI